MQIICIRKLYNYKQTYDYYEIEIVTWNLIIAKKTELGLK